MPTLKIPAPLRSYTGGRSELTLTAETAGGLVEAFLEEVPTLRSHLIFQTGNLRPYAHLFVNGEDIRNLQGLDTPLDKDDRLTLVISITGG